MTCHRAAADVSVLGVNHMEIAVVRLPLGPHDTVPATWMQDHAPLFGQAGSVERCFHELCNETCMTTQ